MRFRTFNRIAGAAFLAAGVVAFSTALLMEPPYGDIARVAYYSERKFGWHSAQLILPRHLRLIEAEYRPTDILVFGDSFSSGDYTEWTDLLARDTGLSVGVMPVDAMARVIASPEFRAHPPPLVVFESVERDLVVHLAGIRAQCAETASSPAATPIGSIRLPSRAPHLMQPMARVRPREMDPWDMQIDYAFNFAVRNLLRPVLWSSAYPVPLSRDDLFSNASSGSLLVYYMDFSLRQWTPGTWKQIVCDLRELQNRASANGRTNFLAIIPPDKLTAYAPYLADPELRGISHLSSVLSAPNLNILRTDTVLAAAIANGAKDIYLPDDTHWSYDGQKAVADALEAYLRARNLL